METLKKDLEEDKVNLKDVHILFLDPSSSCTGYTLAAVDFESRKANILETGAIWFDKNWTNQQKYHYLYRALTVYFNIVGQIDYCIAEQYMINPKKKMGCMVSPELHGVVQVALAEIDVKYDVMAPQSWRSQLGIKKDESGDYKQPTKQKVLEFTNIPEKVVSNITNTERNTPSDVYDSIGVCLGSLKQLGVDKINFDNMKIQQNIDAV